MEAITDGVITTFNGAWTCLGALTSPIGIALSVVASSMAWLSLIEIELMNRSGAKPQVGRH